MHEIMSTMQASLGHSNTRLALEITRGVEWFNRQGDAAVYVHYVIWYFLNVAVKNALSADS